MTVMRLGGSDRPIAASLDEARNQIGEIAEAAVPDVATGLTVTGQVGSDDGREVRHVPLGEQPRQAIGAKPGQQQHGRLALARREKRQPLAVDVDRCFAAHRTDWLIRKR